MEVTLPSNGGENLPVLKPELNALVFGTTDPEEVISKSTRIANLLSPIVEKTHMFAMIGGKKHIMAEGWSTMLAMLGIFPSTVYSKQLDREGEIAYESEVVLKHISGAEVGRGDAICSSKERNWSNRDEFTIKSMSQTRAFGKAARQSFSFIVKLAGYEATAVEEMPHEMVETKHEHIPETPVVNDRHEEMVVFVPSEVKAFKSKKGTPYFKVFDSEGVAYSTFDKTVAEVARLAAQTNVEVVLKYELGQYGPKILKLEMKGGNDA